MKLNKRKHFYRHLKLCPTQILSPIEKLSVINYYLVYTAINLRSLSVSNQEEVASFLKKGYSNRSIAATNMNVHSSRAHTIATIYVKQIQSNAKATLSSQISIVDLAGRYIVFVTYAFCRQEHFTIIDIQPNSKETVLHSALLFIVIHVAIVNATFFNLINK